MNNKQNAIWHIYLQGSDLQQRETEVLKDVCRKIDFKPDMIISRSSWWGSKEIGAFFVNGNYEGQDAVLKIQGVKPTVSEVYMIQSFAKNNYSRLVRPPKLYAFLPWNEKKRYEALILEPVEKRVVQTPATTAELDKFFATYEDYRQNCLNAPWLEKPEQTISQWITENFKGWRKASFKLFPTHPFRQDQDIELINIAVEVLAKGYQGIEFEFQHGHFSEWNMREKNGEIILLSNLYWGWKPPLYDAVFGQHWFIYHLAEVKGITPEQIEEQRRLWLERIEALSSVKDNQRLYYLALLERAAAGLNLDALSVNQKKPIAEYLVTKTREQVKNLLREIQS
jgi:hypothetical protein